MQNRVLCYAALIILHHSYDHNKLRLHQIYSACRAMYYYEQYVSQLKHGGISKLL